LFESPAQVLVNTVNTVGVMGKGVAKRFKDIYPEMYEDYQFFCEKKLLEIGKLWIYKSENKWILNFPTKKHWRNPSKIEYIEEGLKKFVNTYQDKGIISISFPQLGCGNGGLNWENEVKPLMEFYLKSLPIDVFIHIRKESTAKEHMNIEETKNWLQTSPRALSFNQVWDDLVDGLIDKNFEIYTNHTEWHGNLEKDEDDENKLVFESRDSQVYIYKDTLMSVWINLRNNGYFFKNDLPEGLDKYAEVVLTLFNILDYIEPVEIAKDFDTKGNLLHETGIVINNNKLPIEPLTLKGEQEIYED
ncbi:macro domain-containing protein, partial [Listeria innocua]|nr:macro domain-containing protein [Listeria innocua]